MPWFIRNAMLHAAGVVFVSESTLRDADRLVPGRRARGAVIPLGVDSYFAEPSSPQEISELHRKLGLSQPFILNIGTIEPRKNLVVLIDAFEMLADRIPGITLIIVGKWGWKFADFQERLKNTRHSSRIRHIGFVSDDQKRALLYSCALFVYPSLYEGFGLPLLEAMAAGAPVISGRLSSLPEVVGDAGILVDPTDAKVLSNAIEQVLRDSNLQEHMRMEGRNRASFFTWHKTAELTYRFYEQITGTASSVEAPKW